MYDIKTQTVVELPRKDGVLRLAIQKWNLVLAMVDYNKTFGGDAVDNLVRLGWIRSKAAVAVRGAQDVLTDGDTPCTHRTYVTLEADGYYCRITSDVWESALAFVRLFPKTSAFGRPSGSQIEYFAKASDITDTMAAHVLVAAFSEEVLHG